MGFLDGLGAAAGNSVLAFQDYEQKQANIAHTRAVTDDTRALARMREQNAASEQAARQAAAAREAATAGVIKDFSAAQQEADTAYATDPLKMSELYSKFASKAIAAGNPSLADQFQTLAKKNEDIAKERQGEVAKKVATAKEAFAKSAIDFSQNPTPEGMQNVARAAIEAGVDPATIPKTPTEFAAFAKRSATAAMSSKDILAAQEKAREFDVAEEGRRKDRQMTHEERQGRMAMIAAMRESMVNKPEKLTATEKNTVTGVLGAAGEVTSALAQAIEMPAGARGNIFAHVKDGTVTEALTRTGAQLMVKEQTQMFESLMAGLSLEVGRTITLGAGKSPNDSTIKELERAIKPMEGDTNYTAMYKLSTAARIVHNRLSTLPQEGLRPSQEREIKHQMAELSRFPNPMDIAKKAMADKTSREQLARFQGTLGEAMRPIQEGTKSHPADIQAILNAQKAGK